MRRIALALCAALPLLALAAEPGWYTNTGVASASARFAAAANTSAPRYDKAQADIKAVGAALEELELGALLIGERAPAGFADWAKATRKQTNALFLAFERDAGATTDAYSAAFEAAVGRALTQVGKSRPVTECKVSRVNAMVGKGGCPGEDLSKQIAAIVDKDAALEKAVAEISAQPWPRVAAEPQTWAPAPLTGTENIVSLPRLAKAFAAGAVKAHQDALLAALEPLEADLEDGKPEARAKAKEARAAYEAAMAKTGAALLTATQGLAERAQKTGGLGPIGVCPNPTALGGCTGEDISGILIALGKEDKKFQKAVADLQG